ncbi:cell wall-binding repeat-containing protein [Euzebya tangerina]|uniref:cell wall-binding repeat-containing protein n=1 Tax=Euzebya tangerina TaxID=591198 RepID=UPI0013C3678B|nr:cell wall-binding repeat-containing protein [Euzebya tangerina]
MRLSTGKLAAGLVLAVIWTALPLSASAQPAQTQRKHAGWINDSHMAYPGPHDWDGLSGSVRPDGYGDDPEVIADLLQQAVEGTSEPVDPADLAPPWDPAPEPSDEPPGPLTGSVGPDGFGDDPEAIAEALQQAVDGSDPPTEPDVPPVPPTPTDSAFDQRGEVQEVVRLAGLNRVTTALAIAQSLTRESAPPEAVIIASADNARYADALSAATVSAEYGAPVLLTYSETLHPDVEQTLADWAGDDPTRLTVLLVGGTVALSTQVEDAVQAGGYIVSRAAGPNRFATAVQLAQIADIDSPTHVMVANGGRDEMGAPAFQDALVAGAAAGEYGVLLLSDGTRMPAETAAYINEESVGKNYYAIGAAAQAAYPNGIPVGGNPVDGNDEVYATSVAVAQRFTPGFTRFGLASGERFPDGLAGGGHAGRLDVPLLLSTGTGLPDVVLEHVAAQPRETAYVYGGVDAIDESLSLQIGVSDYQTNCGWTGGILFGVECRVTLSRIATQQFCDEWCGRADELAIGGATAAGICAIVGSTTAGVGCVVALGTGGTFFLDLQSAADQGACFAYGFLYSALVGTAATVIDPTEVRDGAVCDDASRLDTTRREN